MTILDPEAGYVVVINTFSVDPARAEELLTVLSDGTAEAVRKRHGFISANWHMADDRKHVTNYAQWRSQADIDAMLADPVIQTYLKRAGEIAQRIEPISYALRETHGPAD